MTFSICIYFYGKTPVSNSNLKNQNAFTKGSTNLRVPTVTNHELSTFNTNGQKSVKQGHPKSQKEVGLETSYEMRIQYKKQERPLSDYKWLCLIDSSKGVEIGSTYTNEKAALAFVHSIAGAERSKTVKLMKEANLPLLSDNG